jgi:hypothetical protein
VATSALRACEERVTRNKAKIKNIKYFAGPDRPVLMLDFDSNFTPPIVGRSV